MNTVIAILGAVAGVTGLALGIWHGWKARRR